MLASIEQPQPEPGIKRIVVNGRDRLPVIAAENGFLTAGSGLKRLVSYWTDAFSGTSTPAIKNAVRSFVQFPRRLSPLCRCGIVIELRHESPGWSERAAARRRRHLP